MVGKKSPKRPAKMGHMHGMAAPKEVENPYPNGRYSVYEVVDECEHGIIVKLDVEGTMGIIDSMYVIHDSKTGQMIPGGLSIPAVYLSDARQSAIDLYNLWKESHVDTLRQSDSEGSEAGSAGQAA